MTTEPGRERPTDADSFRAAWAVAEAEWDQTFARARGFSAEQLHERVDGEWSFIQTQRHLVFATDAWVRRALLGDPTPWHPLDLPHDDMDDQPGVPRDYAARPTLDEVLALRADRMSTVRGVIAGLTDEALDTMTVPVLEPGYPESEAFLVRRCVGAVVSEERAHRTFAERDLDLIQSRSSIRSRSRAAAQPGAEPTHG